MAKLLVRVVQLPPSGSTVNSIFGRTGTVISSNGDYTASQITNVPSGGMTATTVQAAINQLAIGGAVTPSALTSNSDTNVTVSLAGTPTLAVLQATSITVGWTGTLAVGRGGLGTSTLTNNAVLLGAGSSTLVPITPGSTGTVLTSPGGGAAPTWQAAATGSFAASPILKVDDTNVTVAWSGASTTAVNGTTTLTVGWTSTLAVARGGTGTNTLISNGVLIGAGTGSVAPLAAAGSGTVLTGVSSAVPAFTATVQLGVPGALLGKLVLAGNTSGTITIQGQAAAGTYNFNLPTSAGASGQPLLSGGGGSTATFFGTLSVQNGGTGTGTWATNTIIVGGTTSTGTFAQVTSGASGTVLTSQGVGVAPAWQAVGAATDAANPPQGRLTLTTGVAITTSDVTGATTHYYTPALGFFVPITTDGTTFTNTAFTELSQATTDTTKSPGSVTISSNYDIFVWSDAGTLRATRGPPWSSSTSRGTGVGTTEIDFTTKFPTNKNAITNGPAANRGVLVGSVRSDASSQLKDTFAFRWVSNIYNTTARAMRVQDAAVSYTYGTSTIRQANANTANQLDFLDSLGTQMIDVQILSSGSHGAAGGVATSVLIGIDSTSAFVTGSLQGINQFTVAGFGLQFTSNWNGYAGIGRHTAVWLESGPSSGTTTFYGLNGNIQSGIQGSIQG